MLPLLIRLSLQDDPDRSGVWILRRTVEKMNCQGPDADPYWEELYQLLQTDRSTDELLQISADLFMPFGVSDPVLALACPSGAAALLYKLASQWDPRSGLRLLHLAKLFTYLISPSRGIWGSYVGGETFINYYSRLLENSPGRDLILP